MAHSMGFVAGVAVSKNISGGHVNPAVTFGAFVGGHRRLSLIKLISYWIGQFLGSIFACLLLKLATNNMDIRAFVLSEDSTVRNALLREIVMTYGFVCRVYAIATDPQRGNNDTIAPIVMGFLIGANILSGGPFTDASMNPALAFGPALVNWTWSTHHWVFWIGPLIGGGLAGLTCEAFRTLADPKFPLSSLP